MKKNGFNLTEKDPFIAMVFNPENRTECWLHINKTSDKEAFDTILHMMITLENRSGISIEQICSDIVAQQGNFIQQNMKGIPNGITPVST